MNRTRAHERPRNRGKNSSRLILDVSIRVYRLATESFCLGTPRDIIKGGNLGWGVGVAKSIEDTLGKISDKLDDLQKSVHSIDKEVALQKADAMIRGEHIKGLQEEAKRNNDILQENTNSLNEHMHRTDLLEKLVTEMDNRLTPLEKEKIEKEAISKHRRETLIRWGKILGALTALGGVIAAAKPLILLLLV